MTLWRTVAPDIAYTSPATYSCLTGELSSNRKYSSTVIVRPADASLIHSRYARPPEPRNRKGAERIVCLQNSRSGRVVDCRTAVLWWIIEPPQKPTPRVIVTPNDPIFDEDDDPPPDRR